jgi:MFS superfamily sulfate permease-like transporter
MLLLSYLKKKWVFKEFSDKKQLRTDILSGLTVALALVPEAIAFSFVAGINPMVWLHAAFIVGLITSVFGGRPGMISGATWALAVVMVSLVAQHGIEYLFATLVMMWALQILFWVFKFAKFVRLIPHSVMFCKWFGNYYISGSGMTVQSCLRMVVLNCCYNYVITYSCYYGYYIFFT